MEELEKKEQIKEKKEKDMGGGEEKKGWVHSHSKISPDNCQDFSLSG